MRPLRTLSVAAVVLGLTISVVSPASADLNDGTVASADGTVIPCQTTLDGPYWDPDYDNEFGYPGFHAKHVFRCADEPDAPAIAYASTFMRLAIQRQSGQWHQLLWWGRTYTYREGIGPVPIEYYHDYGLVLGLDYCPRDGTHTYRLRARTLVIDLAGVEYVGRHSHVRTITCSGGHP